MSNLSFLLFLIFLIVNSLSDNEFFSRKSIRDLEENQFQNIRIFVDYLCLSSRTDFKIIEQGILKAKNALQKLIKVQRLSDKIDFRTYKQHPDLTDFSCTNDLNYREPIEADLVIFIRGPGENEDLPSVFAKPYIIDYVNKDTNNRPLFGKIVYNPSSINIDDQESKIQAISVIFLHEFTHILGFTKKILLNQGLIEKKEVKSRMRNETYEKFFAKGPKALKIAQEYFNCSNLDGIELDDLYNGESDDDNILHWNARILLGDYMISELYYVDQAISEITLALLDDFEWYEVNYYTGGLMKFGKNKGCSFLTEDCYVYNEKQNGIETPFQNEFCSNIYQDSYNSFGTCSSGRQSMAYCSNDYLYKYIYLHKTDYKRDMTQEIENKFFKMVNGFSPNNLVECCPFSNSDINTYNPEYNYYGSCKYGNGKFGKYLTFLKNNEYQQYNQNISSYIEEEYNETSFCVFSSILNAQKGCPDFIKNILRATCYQMSCSEKSLTIKVGDQFIVCPRKGGPLKIEGPNYNGVLYCPDYNLICTGTELCNNLFDCVEKGSEYKKLIYDYDDVSASIELHNNNANLIDQKDYITEKIYEEGENGTCPRYCQQCNSNKQCTTCDPEYKYYIGTSENDIEPIKCYNDSPGPGYYNLTRKINGKEYYYYYKCIENCNKCFYENKTKCTQCIPTHFINETGKCQERIPGCIRYNDNKTKNLSDNGYAPSYYECLDCNNSDNYYCLDMNRTTCKHIPNINLSLYYPMEKKDYSCIQKCRDKFDKCETCNFNSCEICNQSNHTINHFGNCIKDIEHCKNLNLDLNYSQCLLCDEPDDFYCLNGNRNQCTLVSDYDISFYYKYQREYNENSCYQFCNKTYPNLCLACNIDRCTKCPDDYYLNNVGKGYCLDKIENCNEYDLSVNISRCLKCNDLAHYYCIKEDRSKCKYISPDNYSSYFKIDGDDNEHSCVQLCRDKYNELCLECDNTHCLKCPDEYYLNNFGYGYCMKKLDHCNHHDTSVNVSACLECNENEHYYCINNNRSVCSYIDEYNISFYFKIDGKDNSYSCVKLCSEKYTDKCLQCDNTNCLKCIEGYFPFGGECILNLTGCIDNRVVNYDKMELACDECNRDKDYYCINEDKSKCHYLNETSISEYYELPSLDYSCYKHCDNITKYCIKCDSTQCFKCSSQYALSRKTKQCLTPPNSFLENVKCNITTHYLNTTLDSKLNFAQMVKDYFYDLNHISKVEHYVGVNYTMTFYMNSNCTNGLLPQGYYKLDTRELNKTFVDESDLDLVFHLLGIYINNNYQSHLRFYSPEDQKWMDPINNCNTCLDKNYIVTNNLYNILNDTIGTQFTEFILEKNIDIFEENSEIYTDTCNNLTLYEIDIPINLRKNYLFLHEYLEPLLCHDIACEFSELNMTAKTSTCLCKMGNEFSEIFEPIDFNFVPYKSTEKTKGFSEAIKVIKCMLKGIKYSNFKINLAAIIILAAFIIQIICYIAYGCFGKPLINIKDLPNVANPPKAEDDTNRIYLFADWNMNLPGEEKNEAQQAPNEREIIIQPRDDSGEEIVSEEKSFTNDFFSNISIDTNAGGSLFPNKRLNRNLKALEKKKKVLILLGNKGKKKLSVEQSSINNEQEIISENDDMPLSRRRKDDKSGLLRNYWIFLSIKQHIINYFADIKCCKMTESYIPLSLRFIRSLFLVVLSIILSILWLDPIYFEKKWNHFNEKYSISNSPNTNIEIPLSERVSYASSKGFGYTVVNLIVLIFADFIIGILFFSLRAEIENILSRGKMSKLQDIILKARRNYNIFYVINFILIIIFFLSLCGFGVTYPGGIVDCLTITFLAILLLEIIPFIWSLILALFRYFGYKKKSSCMIDFSEFFLF